MPFILLFTLINAQDSDLLHLFFEKIVNFAPIKRIIYINHKSNEPNSLKSGRCHTVG